MRPRFQADADLNQTIVFATIRHEPGIDFQTATAAGLAGLSDLDVLDCAARTGRILVTHDLRTMPRHFAEFLRHSSSPGLILVPPLCGAAHKGGYVEYLIMRSCGRLRLGIRPHQAGTAHNG